jgi:hypothetical protein
VFCLEGIRYKHGRERLSNPSNICFPVNAYVSDADKGVITSGSMVSAVNVSVPYSLLQTIVPSRRFLASLTCHFVARRYRRIHSLVKKYSSISEIGANSLFFLLDEVGNSLSDFIYCSTSSYFAFSSAVSSTGFGSVDADAGALNGNLRGSGLGSIVTVELLAWPSGFSSMSS